MATTLHPTIQAALEKSTEYDKSFRNLRYKDVKGDLSRKEFRGQRKKARDLWGQKHGNRLKDILGRQDEAQKVADEANEARYQDILSLIGGLGATGRERISRSMERNLAQSEQDLTSRGLGNTTIRSSVRRGIMSDAEFERMALEESLMQNKAEVMMQKTEMPQVRPSDAYRANLIAQERLAKASSGGGGGFDWASTGLSIAGGLIGGFAGGSVGGQVGSSLGGMIGSQLSGRGGMGSEIGSGFGGLAADYAAQNKLGYYRPSINKASKATLERY